MCGIGGFISKQQKPENLSQQALQLITKKLHHRGPDGNGHWLSDNKKIGFAHVRLKIIDFDSGAQPMKTESGNVITYNGEIYNYLELRQELGEHLFTTSSDTEVILRAYEKWGAGCVNKLRGMFAFAIWDRKLDKVFFARDRFGIKPFYYWKGDDTYIFASEVKALLPFMPKVEISHQGLRDYLSYQFCVGDKTMFKDIKQLPPGHHGFIDSDLNCHTQKYWEVHYQVDSQHDEAYFTDQIREIFTESVKLHTRSDVEVGAYLSGGTDSSLVASLTQDVAGSRRIKAFTGKFSENEKFDESKYARQLAKEKGFDLFEIDIAEGDFINNIEKVIYHMDYPTAGPGSFPQYMVSGLVKQHVKVVLGGQGGDEIFGGYVRYLVAYFEQCIKGAIEGTLNNGKFVVSYESIIPNLVSLQNYRPLIQEFWTDGVFESRDKRYFKLINRANKLKSQISPEFLDTTEVFEEFKSIYWGENVSKEAYFDSMTHFDFKTLLPALLHVEDRMSMAHGIESRVPFLDHPLVECMAKVPATFKFKNGELKRLLKHSFNDKIPGSILNRKDKMGFPVPFNLWLDRGGKVHELYYDLMNSTTAKNRSYLMPQASNQANFKENVFSRETWALLNLELWQKMFIDSHQQVIEF